MKSEQIMLNEYLRSLLRNLKALPKFKYEFTLINKCMCQVEVSGNWPSFISLSLSPRNAYEHTSNWAISVCHLIALTFLGHAAIHCVPFERETEREREAEPQNFISQKARAEIEATATTQTNVRKKKEIRQRTRTRMRESLRRWRP